jgi:CheY-like chemotaxis protein
MASTVLVVEDERKLRDLVRSYLERAGFTVLTTGSGAEAVTMAMTSAPDLVILDLPRPGPESADRAREGQGGTLGVRLALAFLCVALAAVALLAGLTAVFAAADVSHLSAQQRTDLARAAAFAAGVAYDRNDTWSAADLSLSPTRPRGPGWPSRSSTRPAPSSSSRTTSPARAGRGKASRSRCAAGASAPSWCGSPVPAWAPPTAA